MPAEVEWARCNTVPEVVRKLGVTAVFAKVGLTGIESDLATLVRTGVIAVVLAAFVVGRGKWTNPLTMPGEVLLFLNPRPPASLRFP